MRFRNSLAFFVLIPAIVSVFSCTRIESIEKELEGIEEKLSSLEKDVTATNNNAIALNKFVKGNILIVGSEFTENGYELSLSDGTKIKVSYGDKAPKIVPIIGIDDKGNWISSFDGGRTFSIISGSANIKEKYGNTPLVGVDSERFWIVSLDGGKTWKRHLGANGKPMSATDGVGMSGKASFFSDVIYKPGDSEMKFVLLDGREVIVPVLNSFYLKIKDFKPETKIGLNEKLVYEVEASDIADAVIKSPEGWSARLSDSSLEINGPSSGSAGDYNVDIIIFSEKKYVKNISLKFTLNPVDISVTDCKQWNDFVAGNSDNVLLDFSYAGYKHGETAPPDVYSLGYKVYNVADYGAVPNDGLSDRDAFLKAFQDAIGPGAKHNPSAKAIIYFPEGEFILHTSADDVGGKSSALLLRVGDFVLKGAGRDKTTLLMTDPNLPANSDMYSSPVLIDLRHYSGLTDLTPVTSDAKKGSFSLNVASSKGISAGDWVCLFLQNNDKDLIAEELSPYSVEATMTDILNEGVKVFDYHQVASVVGNTVTFVEPIMKEVSSKWGWKICKYPHYENVGVEDITFKGRAKDDFLHHGSWQDDGAYKMVNMSRITNGWIRRVRFTSVSEASSIINSANVSVYDVIIDGNRGHSAIRAQGSSRIFIGAVIDKSDGPLTVGRTWKEGAGQFHACGVAKPSMGTVLWRNVWGSDSCFESHATQPRATLIDNCAGGWLQYRQGGHESQVPNHLGDLVVWNFKSTTAFAGDWLWWSSGKWWKFLPPVIVGFHGEACSFDASQVKVDAYHGTKVDPESLYEAQLRNRLGYVPAWLNTIK